jgi:hypothetical protein
VHVVGVGGHLTGGMSLSIGGQFNVNRWSLRWIRAAFIQVWHGSVLQLSALRRWPLMLTMTYSMRQRP